MCLIAVSAALQEQHSLYVPRCFDDFFEHLPHLETGADALKIFILRNIICQHADPIELNCGSESVFFT